MTCPSCGFIPELVYGEWWPHVPGICPRDPPRYNVAERVSILRGLAAADREKADRLEALADEMEAAL